MMNTAASEWAAKVAARNEIENAKARISQPTFDWTGGGATIAAPLTQEQRDLRNSPLGITLGLYR